MPHRLHVPIRVSKAIDTAVREQLDMSAIVVVSTPSPSFFSSMFTVHQKDKERPIFNCKPLNRYLIPPPFSLPTLAMVRASLFPGAFISTIDLHKAYTHLPIPPQFRPFLRFRYKGVIYEYQCLPFGLCTAPTTSS